MLKNYQGKHSAGMTLIELMIVIAIVAVLVALAVPAYKNYTIRTKIAECINNAAVAKVQISEYRQTMGSWPPSPVAAGIYTDPDTNTSEFCHGFTSYDSSDGSFTIDIDEVAVDASLNTIAPIMTPEQDAVSTVLNWDCTVGTTAVSDIRFLPSTCRDS
jgi:prepilin-type N-terminal cleavage/methylation domain-containing protein